MGIAGVANAAVIMDATLHNGSFSDGTVGYWSGAGSVTGSPVAPPPGWNKSGQYVYTAASLIQAYHNAQVFNNTGELVQANHAYTLSAGLGDRFGTIDVFVRATENADGTGASVDLTHISRTGTQLGGFGLFNVSGTGLPADPSLAGYYVRVEVITGSDPTGQNYNFDNIGVTSAEVPEPATLGALSVGGVMALARRRRV